MKDAARMIKVLCSMCGILVRGNPTAHHTSHGYCIPCFRAEMAKLSCFRAEMAKLGD